MALALGVERGRADRVLHDSVTGEQPEPRLAIAGLDRGRIDALAQIAAEWWRSWPHLGHDVVGEPAQVVEIDLEPLGVGSHCVGPPEADDHIGHPLLFEPVDPVDRKCLERDHVDLEVTVGRCLPFP